MSLYSPCDSSGIRTLDLRIMGKVFYLCATVAGHAENFIGKDLALRKLNINDDLGRVFYCFHTLGFYNEADTLESSSMLIFCYLKRGFYTWCDNFD